MSAAAINPKGPSIVPKGKSIFAWVETYLGSSVGQKILVGTTGLLLVGFVLFHMIGNLKMFSGRESINKYAYFLKHDLGALILIARAGLLGLFVVHLFLAIRLKLRSKAARPIGYAKQNVAQANPASTTMIWTGLVTLAFVLFHLAHYTFGWIHQVSVDGGTTNYLELKDADGRHDVYAMVKAGFGQVWLSLIYLVCQLLLFVHLSHGIASSLQTLGLVGKKFTPAARLAGWAISGAIFAGNFAIVMAVWLDPWLKLLPE